MGTLAKEIVRTRTIPIVKNVDVLVAGAGPAGLGAAITAARKGYKTLLIEKFAFLGGAATAMWVLGFPYRQFVPERKLLAGFAEEFLLELAKLEPWTHDTPEEAAAKETYIRPCHAEAIKYLCFKMTKEAGVEVLVHTTVVDAIVEDNVCKGVIIENKSGRQAIMAKMTIDCTGDGDVGVFAGAPYELGRQEVDGIADGLMIPASLSCRVRGIDMAKYNEYIQKDPKLTIALNKAAEAGDLIVPEQFSGFLDWWSNYTVIANKKTRIGARAGGKYDDGRIMGAHALRFNAADGNELSREEIKQRMWVVEFLMVLRKYVPGWENAFVDAVPPLIGIRETRRIMGEHVLTREESDGSTCDDPVCITCGRYITPAPEMKSIPVAPPFMIPYRCLVPKVVDNLLIAGRCISWTHGALVNNARDMNTCFALGQAAATASVLAIENKVTPRKLDYKILEKDLRSQGVILDMPEGTDIPKIKDELRKQGVKFWIDEERAFEGGVYPTS